MAGPAEGSQVVAALAKFGFSERMVVQELGYDGDVDDELRFAIEETTDADLEDEDFGGVADAVLIWWRADDGDLVDAFVDAMTNLADKGFLLLMTPKPGRPGTIEAHEVSDAAQVAGLNLVGTASLCADWAATRVIAPHAARR